MIKKKKIKTNQIFTQQRYYDSRFSMCFDTHMIQEWNEKEEEK